MRLRQVFLLTVYGALTISAPAATYYVDYDSGSDSNAGTSTNAPFKFSPGDPQASGNAAAVSLTAGDTVLFKGGVVYRGSINVNQSGAPGARIVYQGDGWGSEKAVVDGSDLLTNWTACASAEDAGGNPAYTNLFYTYVPENMDPFLLNLHEIDPVSGDDEFLWISQMPNPADFYFFNVRDSLHPVTHENLTLTSIVSPDFLTQTDSNHWNGASVLVWVNPNWTVRQDIEQFIPAEDKIIFTSLADNAIYDDGRDQYFAIYNHPNAIDTPGEYAVCPPEQGLRKIVLWPRSTNNMAMRISASERITGFDFGPASHVEIGGFEIRKFGGSGLREGCGIQAYGGYSAVLTNIVLRDNFITHNKHGTKGYGGIFANNLHDSLIVSNSVVKNPLHAGIFLSGCEDSTVQGNTIQYTGNTALRLYTSKRMKVLNNTINHIYSTHANGLTLYLGCYDVLIANNTITETTTPITHQNSANLYFINNVTDGGDLYKNVNEWPLSSSGAQEHGKIIYLNNTFVNADSNGSLSLGQDEDNEYIVLNNILDGMSLNYTKTSLLELHDYNLFTGRNWSQVENYGWTDAVHEVFTTNSADTIFVDPAAMDYHLASNSPAIYAGSDVSSYYPTNIFPDFDFTRDAGGQVRVGWDAGAYALDSSVEPSALFSAAPGSGSAPLTVTFTDNSSGAIANRFWSFGDGSTSNAAQTSLEHTYTSAGVYTVELVVSGPAGSSTNTQLDLITVSNPPPPPSSVSVVSETSDTTIGLSTSRVPVVKNPAGDTLIIGDDGYLYNGGDSCAIMVFELPDRDGRIVTSADLSVDWYANHIIGVGESDETEDVLLPKWVDLYGVRYSSSGTVLSSDYGFKNVGTNNGALLQSAYLFKAESEAMAYEFAQTDASGAAALTAWLNAQYDAGAQPGDYVFLRLHAAFGSGNPFVVAAGNNGVQNKPTLTLGLGTAGDVDGDGLPDEWETEHFGGATNANPFAAASNGVNTVLETYIAGLDPTDPTARFTLSNVWKTLSWNAVSGRVYSVYWTTNLFENFQPLETNIVWPQNSWTDEVAGAEGFYKLKVKLGE